jgi:transcriptional regulator with XRE-family HTH domain
VSDRLLADWIAAVEAKRKQLGWSQLRLEVEAGIPVRYWGKVLRGEKDNPTLELVGRVSTAIDLWPTWNIAPAQ